MTFLRPRPSWRVLSAVALGVFASTSVLRAQDSTATVRYKGVNVSFIGFTAAEGVVRHRAEEADIGSSFNAIPFSGTSAGQTSEFRITGRQSRIGLLMQGNADDTKLTGFWEADFLGVGISSNSVESNSYVLRVRQFWGQAAFKNGWTLTGGQMWSFLTTDKKGLSPRSEAVPLTIEAQYAAGFDWARQAGIRATTAIGSMGSFGVALEGAQTTFSARNAPANILLGQTGGSQLNSTANYSTDFAPDMIAKLAIDTKSMGHWELKAIGRIFRDRVVDAATPTTTRNIRTNAGGVGFGVWLPVMGGGRDMIDLGLSGLYGKGIGRYGTSMLPDATIAADSSLAAIKGAHGLLSVETHPTKMLDVYAYFGGEYDDRTAFVNAAGKGVGYGSPLNPNTACSTEAAPTGQYTPVAGACNADTRALWQANIGFWDRLYKGSAGTLQWGLQYSYTSRNTWADAGGLQPQAIDPMFFGSFRYVLP